jgi:hypothetical protein
LPGFLAGETEGSRRKHRKTTIIEENFFMGEILLLLGEMSRRGFKIP